MQFARKEMENGYHDFWDNDPSPYAVGSDERIFLRLDWPPSLGCGAPAGSWLRRRTVRSPNSRRRTSESFCPATASGWGRIRTWPSPRSPRPRARSPFV